MVSQAYTITPTQAGAGQATSSALSPKTKKPHPFWLGGVAATIAASITQ